MTTPPRRPTKRTKSSSCPHSVGALDPGQISSERPFSATPPSSSMCCCCTKVAVCSFDADAQSAAGFQQDDEDVVIAAKQHALVPFGRAIALHSANPAKLNPATQRVHAASHIIQRAITAAGAHARKSKSLDSYRAVFAIARAFYAFAMSECHQISSSSSSPPAARPYRVHQRHYHRTPSKPSTQSNANNKHDPFQFCLPVLFSPPWLDPFATASPQAEYVPYARQRNSEHFHPSADICPENCPVRPAAACQNRLKTDSAPQRQQTGSIALASCKRKPLSCHSLSPSASQPEISVQNAFELMQFAPSQTVSKMLDDPRFTKIKNEFMRGESLLFAACRRSLLENCARERHKTPQRYIAAEYSRSHPEHPEHP